MNERQSKLKPGCLNRILRMLAFIVVIGTICVGIFYYQYSHPSEDGVCQDVLTKFTTPDSTKTLADYSKNFAHETQQITIANIDHLREIERAGRGYIKEVFWKNNDLMVLTTVGLWQHSHTDWQDEPKLVWTTDQYVDDYSVSPDGSLIAILADTGNIPVLDTATGQVIQTLKFDQNRKSLHRVAISPDNSMLAMAFGFEVQVWNIKAGEIIQSFWDEALYLVKSVAFSPDNEMLAVGGAKAISIWNITSANKVSDIASTYGKADNITFSPDGTVLVTGDSYLPRYARFWDLKTSQLVNKLTMSAEPPDGSGDRQFRVSFTWNGSRFAYGYLLWSSGINKPPINMDIFDVSFNEAGTLVAGLAWQVNSKFYEFEQFGSEGNISIWGVENGTKLVELPDYYGISPLDLVAEVTLRESPPIKYYVEGTDILAVQSKSGKFFIVASNPMDVFPFPPPAIRVCDQAGTQIMSFRMPMNAWMIDDIVISPDERFVALDTAGVFVIDMEAQRISPTITYFVDGMAFSSDSALLAVSYRPSQHREMGIGIWDTHAQEEVTVLKGSTSTLNAITFAENDSLLLTYGRDGTIRFWGVPLSDR